MAESVVRAAIHMLAAPPKMQMLCIFTCYRRMVKLREKKRIHFNNKTTITIPDDGSVAVSMDNELLLAHHQNVSAHLQSIVGNMHIVQSTYMKAEG